MPLFPLAHCLLLCIILHTEPHILVLPGGEVCEPQGGTVGVRMGVWVGGCVHGGEVCMGMMCTPQTKKKYTHKKW